MMTVPDTFKWSDESLEYLNGLSLTQKRAYLKREEIKIRQSLGEAVPTIIFQEIAANIRGVLDRTPMNSSSINKIVSKYNFQSADEIIAFIEENPLNLSVSALSRIAEMSNTSRTDNAAFYTNKALITEMIKSLPDLEKDEIHILEPSAGVGNFIPLIIKRFEGKKLFIDLVDIDPNSSRIARLC
jgi:DNA (cytosine-5)-methyltransferase 1